MSTKYLFIIQSKYPTAITHQPPGEFATQYFPNTCQYQQQQKAPSWLFSSTGKDFPKLISSLKKTLSSYFQKAKGTSTKQLCCLALLRAAQLCLTLTQALASHRNKLHKIHETHF
ncbi:metabotropic glutamate receptor 7 [Platysternon megacephalum]|uniref:Metabotropic glutamate receptor 7 n=1 Tax=Platysternon megacephalum TaxID=55544 RepID=A0A4D9E5E1_9SAUR|nr:metabotropic glutamate receptor 7 [Platysternon megacephalum]